jgi:hypothetical protein
MPMETSHHTINHHVHVQRLGKRNTSSEYRVIRICLPNRYIRHNAARQSTQVAEFDKQDVCLLGEASCLPRQPKDRSLHSDIVLIPTFRASLLISKDEDIRSTDEHEASSGYSRENLTLCHSANCPLPATYSQQNLLGSELVHQFRRLKLEMTDLVVD